MKKTLLIVLFIIPLFVCGQEKAGKDVAETSIKGLVTDENKQPIGYANVMLLRSADSVFVNGVVTKEDGTFVDNADAGQYLLKVSCIGYETKTVDCDLVGDAVINVVLKTSDKTIKEVVVNGVRPTHVLTSEGVLTNVDGTSLSTLSTANDVLRYIPGIWKTKKSVEVFGKGTPIIYINGRLMRDANELDELKGDDIKTIELITSPGARYDATVTSVIKIKTKNVHGEGFGFNLYADYYQSKNIDTFDQLNWNYRKGNVDVFGTFYYFKNAEDDVTDFSQTFRTDTLWQQNQHVDSKRRHQTFSNTVGVNYTIDEDNSVGVRYVLKACPDSKSFLPISSNILANGEYYDRVASEMTARQGYWPSHLLNLYYNGKVGKLGIDLNVDWYTNGNSDYSNTIENSESKDSRVVTTESESHSRMFASKLILSHPLIGGELTFGAEYTNTNRDDDYICKQDYIPNSNSTLKEQRIAPFVEFSRKTPIGQLTCGIRYERSMFDYYDKGVLVDAQSRNEGNWFPSASLRKEIGKVQLALEYTSKTRRPTYRELSNDATYDNRLMWESGNPLLKSERIHNISMTGMWNIFRLKVDYTDERDAILRWSEMAGENLSILKEMPINYPSIKGASAQLIVSPHIGLWTANFSVGVEKQWLNLETETETFRLNKPMFSCGISNMFKLSETLTLGTNMRFESKGDTQNISIEKNGFVADIDISKSFFKEKLWLTFGMSDIFHGDKSRYTRYSGFSQMLKSYEYDSRTVYLAVQFKFNSARNKYKGTGAGNEEKNRL